jgi:hypothetical protein
VLTPTRADADDDGASRPRSTSIDVDDDARRLARSLADARDIARRARECGSRARERDGCSARRGDDADRARASRRRVIDRCVVIS